MILCINHIVSYSQVLHYELNHQLAGPAIVAQQPVSPKGYLVINRIYSICAPGVLLLFLPKNNDGPSNSAAL